MPLNKQCMLWLLFVTQTQHQYKIFIIIFSFCFTPKWTNNEGGQTSVDIIVRKFSDNYKKLLPFKNHSDVVNHESGDPDKILIIRWDGAASSFITELVGGATACLNAVDYHLTSSHLSAQFLIERWLNSIDFLANVTALAVEWFIINAPWVGRSPVSTSHWFST
jgi:hypothetical protein